MDAGSLVLSSTEELFDRKEFSVALVSGEQIISILVYVSYNLPLKCIMSCCNMEHTIAALSELIRAYQSFFNNC